jgi:signal transduction histidine kinase
MKEAVNNAIKYSDGKNIWLSILNEGNFIIAEVKDDGIGFDLSSVNRGNGLSNMESRAESLHAELGIVSNKDNGTRIRLQFDLHPSGGHFQPA